MNRKYFYRALVWILLIVGLTLVTFFNYRMFITNSVKKDIAREETVAQQYDGTTGQIQMLITKINNYNNKVYDDNTYTQMIPLGYDDKEIILDYVERPILLSNASLISIGLKDNTMPTNIKWSSTGSAKDIKGVQITVSFKIADISDLTKYIDELQTSVRCVYFGDLSYTLPANDAQDSSVTIKMIYYVFYNDTETTK